MYSWTCHFVFVLYKVMIDSNYLRRNLIENNTLKDHFFFKMIWSCIHCHSFLVGKHHVPEKVLFCVSPWSKAKSHRIFQGQSNPFSSSGAHIISKGGPMIHNDKILVHTLHHRCVPFVYFYSVDTVGLWIIILIVQISMLYIRFHIGTAVYGKFLHINFVIHHFLFF